MTALITAATKGIGRAITLELAKNHYNLAICARNADDLSAFVSEIKQQFPSIQVYALSTDCSDQQQLSTFIRFVEQQAGTVDVLVNNAGIYLPGSILDEEESAMFQQMDLNFYAAYYLCRHFGRIMRNSGKGHIINICSVAAVKPFISAGSYTVTKFALLGLTKILREELMPHGVKVTAVLPGATLTDSWAGTALSADRFVQTTDIAKSVLSCIQMSPGANVDEIIIRPLAGEI